MGRWTGMGRLILALIVLGVGCAGAAEGDVLGIAGGPCVGPEMSAIARIQGVGPTSPHEGERVDGLAGVVTFADESGFYLQDPGASHDGRASNGVRVDANGRGVLPGDCIVVEGEVTEVTSDDREASETRVAADEVRIVGRGLALPDPVVLGEYLPVGGGDLQEMVRRFEALEGMRVAVDDALVVGPTGRDGFALTPHGSGGVETIGHGRLAEHGLLSEVLLVPQTEPTLSVGDRLQGRLDAIVVPRLGRYWLEVRAPLPAAQRARRPREAVLLAAHSGVLVATMNTMRLGSDMDRIDRLARSIAVTLRAPSLVALQEIERGPARVVLESLSDAIERNGGPRYRSHVLAEQTGPLVTALLTDERRVLARGRPRTVSSGAGAFDGSRLPLVLDTCVGGRQVLVIALHLTSKVADDPLMGAHMPPRSPSTPRRIAQARVIADLVQEASGQGTATLVVGDLNDTPWSQPVLELTGRGLVDLTASLERRDRYSYVYRGSSQLLDYVLTDLSWARGALVDVVHGSADAASVDRDSDHDPVVVRLALPEGVLCSPLAPGE